MTGGDPTLGIIRGLSQEAGFRAWWLVYAARTAGYPVIVTSGHRTLQEQQQLVADGRSRTLDSAHITGDAFDIDWWGWHRDAIPIEWWHIIGPWAERELQLRWGGRWSFRDYGHFELPPSLRLGHV